MSQENVEILLHASKAASAGATVEERELFLSILDPEIAWIDRGGPPDMQGEFHGIDRAREYYARWASAWSCHSSRRSTRSWARLTNTLRFSRDCIIS